MRRPVRSMAFEARRSRRGQRAAAKYSRACADVGADLARQRVEVRIALLVAQLVQELDADAPAVDRLVEIEDEHLEQRHAGRASPSGARRGSPRRRAARRRGRGRAPRRYPMSGGLRRSAMFAVGKPRLRPSFSPCATRPAIANGRPSSAWRARGRPRPAPRAPPSTTRARRRRSTVRIASTLNVAAPRAQRREVAGAPLAEAEVVADQHPARAEARAPARRR